MCDLKRQMKELEESNTRYLESMIGLEEEVRKITSLKSQIEMYKKRVQELHEQVVNDEMKFKKFEYECKSIEEGHAQTVSNLRAERDRTNGELARLKEQHEQLVINSETFNGTEKINFLYLYINVQHI